MEEISLPVNVIAMQQVFRIDSDLIWLFQAMQTKGLIKKTSLS